MSKPTEHKTKKSPNFEKSLIELETIVNTMEKGELSLEDSLKQYESGMNLVRSCQQALTEAEQRIKLIVEQKGAIKTTDFTVPNAE